MTKDMYLELCEALGNEPLEEEMPVEINDLPDLVQQTLQIYYMLKDIWDPMGGNYLGKDTSTLFEFFRLYDIDKAEQLLAVSFIQHMDYVRSKMISSKRESKKPSGKKA